MLGLVRAEKFPIHLKYLFAACSLAFIFLMIGALQFLRFGGAYQTDTQGNQDYYGPQSSFFGKNSNGSWGPAFGWIAAILAMCISFINVPLSYLIAQENGGLFNN